MCFGTLIPVNKNDIISAEYTDKASYVSDTLPTKTFKFTLNNYDHSYDIDNPENTTISLDNNTLVFFRSGYNTYGYEKDINDNLVYDEEGYPIINNPYQLEQIEWEPWRQMILINVSATSGENAIFECGTILDTLNMMTYGGYMDPSVINTEFKYVILAAVRQVLADVGCADVYYSIEWGQDNILDSNGRTTNYYVYYITEPAAVMDVPIAIKEYLQLVALSVGATLLVKNNGNLRYAGLDIDQPETFTNHHNWTYRDFEEIPEPEQLESLETLDDLYFPQRTVTSTDDPNKYVHSDLVITSNGDMWLDHSLMLPRGYTAWAEQTTQLVHLNVLKYGNTRSYFRVSGYNSSNIGRFGASIQGYPIICSIKDASSDESTAKLKLDPKLRTDERSRYDSNGNLITDQAIKTKYLEWYKKKFKYKLKTRGEPLVNAGDYCTIETQFAEEIPGYILQNHWTFDGTWSGDMEVIALDN